MKNIWGFFTAGLVIAMLAEQASATERTSIPVRGATLERVEDLQLGRGFKDSDESIGVTWFLPLKDENGNYLKVSSDIAKKKCEEVGGRLPKRFHEVGRLYYLLNAGDDEYTEFAVPNELSFLKKHFFWFENYDGNHAGFNGSRPALVYTSDAMVICVKG